jgi:hypothetical protein
MCLLETDPALEGAVYQAAVEVLLAVQAAAPPTGVPDLTGHRLGRGGGAWRPTGMPPRSPASGPTPGPFTRALTAALARHADGPRILILRDYHAGNLIWLPDRKGAARVGVLDFQQAQMGQPVYDLISLVQDARRDVGAATEAACRAQFAAAMGRPVEALDTACAVIAAQRALRILGIFARLCLVAAKPAYVALIPRVWAQLTEALRHPDLAELRAVCRALLARTHPPSPGPDHPAMRPQPLPLMLFAAGFGTRMGALTATRPKPLVPVLRPAADRPGAGSGARGGGGPVVANTHYLGQMIADHLAGSGVAISHEPGPILETGGGLKQALPLLGAAQGGPVMTLNPDAVWRGPNPLALLQAAWDPGADGRAAAGAGRGPGARPHGGQVPISTWTAPAGWPGPAAWPRGCCIWARRSCAPGPSRPARSGCFPCMASGPR